MKRKIEAEAVDSRLREVPGGEPPERLLDEIQSQIPERLGPGAATPTPGWYRHRWRLAAAVLVLGLGGLLAHRVVREAPAPAEAPLAAPGPVSEVEVAAAEDEAAPRELEATSPVDVPGRAEPSPAPSPDRSPAAQERPVSGDRIEPPADQRSELKKDRLDRRSVAQAVPPPPEPEPRRRQAAREVGADPSTPEPGIVTVVREAPLLMEGRTVPRPGAPSRQAPPPSTGGTAEPNERPYGDMFFRSSGVNPFVDTEDDPLSTFGLDVDTGSYTMVRSYLQRGHLPPPEAVRVEELVNFFDYGDGAPSGADFAIAAEGAPTPFGEGERYYLLRFHLQARRVERANRSPADLVFVVDVSGSMARENRLGLVRRALALLLDQLGAGDRVGLVTYGSRGAAVLEPTSDRAAVRRALDSLAPAGSTNAEEGLVLGYEMARRNLREETISRIVLCTDGVANVGRTGADTLLERIAAEAVAGIELTAVGVGMGNYNDLLLERLADRGNGRYAYVDSLEEARRIFVEGLTGTLQTVATDARVQVEFDPAVVARYRLLGYENRDLADERFRDDTADAGEIGAGHQVTALYEIKLKPEARRRDPLAILRLRYRSLDQGRVVEQERSIRLADFARAWDRAGRGLRLAGLVAEFAEILRGSYWARQGDLDDLFRRVQRLAAEHEGDADVAELAALVGKAARLRPSPASAPIER